VPLTLALVSLVFAAYQFALTFSSGEWRDPSNEMVSKWDERVGALREALPSGVSQVGYVDDSFTSGSPLDGSEFQLMQYSVAPVALQMGVKQEWIVGNINDDENLEAWLTDTIGQHEVQEFGFGLYLIHDVGN
jgi:hypothetical protein